MRLYGFLRKHEDGYEATVTDNVYDTETYFYNDIDDLDNDLWQKAMMELAHLLSVVEVTDSDTAVVNMSELIEKKMDKLKEADLFQSYDIDDIMAGMDSIISGNVSEKWMTKFVDCLK